MSTQSFCIDKLKTSRRSSSERQTLLPHLHLQLYQEKESPNHKNRLGLPKAREVRMRQTTNSISKAMMMAKMAVKRKKKARSLRILLTRFLEEDVEEDHLRFKEREDLEDPGVR